MNSADRLVQLLEGRSGIPAFGRLEHYHGDLAVARRVVGEDSYALRELERPPRLVVDCDAHLGGFLASLLDCCAYSPGWQLRYHGFSADPLLHDHAVQAASDTIGRAPFCDGRVEAVTVYPVALTAGCNGPEVKWHSASYYGSPDTSRSASWPTDMTLGSMYYLPGRIERVQARPLILALKNALTEPGPGTTIDLLRLSTNWLYAILRELALTGTWRVISVIVGDFELYDPLLSLVCYCTRSLGVPWKLEILSDGGIVKTFRLTRKPQ